jgi:hypothetical protein
MVIISQLIMELLTTIITLLHLDMKILQMYLVEKKKWRFLNIDTVVYHT